MAVLPHQPLAKGSGLPNVNQIARVRSADYIRQPIDLKDAVCDRSRNQVGKCANGHQIPQVLSPSSRSDLKTPSTVVSDRNRHYGLNEAVSDRDISTWDYQREHFMRIPIVQRRLSMASSRPGDSLRKLISLCGNSAGHVTHVDAVEEVRGSVRLRCCIRLQRTHFPPI